MARIDTLVSRLSAGEKVLLGGAMGTEIQRRGVQTELPLWSASALASDPQIVKQIHKDYIEAGAEIITTNTFRTNVRAFKFAEREHEARSMTLRACQLADDARAESGNLSVLIGGSIAPVEDCYEPSLVPGNDELEQEHATLATWLQESNVIDFIFIETMNCIREARIAAIAAQKTRLPFMISLVCNSSGDLLSGESLQDAVSTLSPLRPLALLTNCRPLNEIEASVEKLLLYSSVPVGVYANGDGKPDDVEGWKFEGTNPEDRYVERATGWLDKGVSIVGSCCGSTPEYTRRLSKLLKQRTDKTEA